MEKRPLNGCISSSSISIVIIISAVYALLDGYAPFMSLAERETMLVSESILAAPGPGQYDPKIPQDAVKVLRN